jgi:hypothetical protein
MATKVEVVNAQELLKQAVPTGHWAFVSDADHSSAVAALAKLIGRESKQPSWQRRLAISTDAAKTYLLVVDSCHWREPSSVVPFDDADSYATTALPVALPLEVGVQLLQSEANPELELARRRAKAAAREAARVERNRAEIARSRAEAAEIARVEQERIDCRADNWAKLSPLEKFAARLALAVEKADPSLAAGIRAAIDAPTSDDAYPRARWFEGFPRILEDQRVAQVYAALPKEQEFALRMQYGHNPATIVAAWEALRAANQKTRAA